CEGPADAAPAFRYHAGNAACPDRRGKKPTNPVRLKGGMNMRATVLSLVFLAAAPALAQEKFVSSNMDVRTILSFKVSDAAVVKLLPAGWEIDSPKSGPSKGANVRVTFIDQMANWDATGKATPPGRNLVFGLLAKKRGAETGGL